MLRHAYLILIHEYSYTLETLIRLLDSENSAIFIHVDKRQHDIDPDRLRKLAVKSEMNVYRKYRVNWGTNSITLAMIYLLQKSLSGSYDYYHVISGSDLPIKGQSDFYEFFERNNGKEFIHFGTEQYQKDIDCRYNVYHFFSKQLGRKRDRKFWVMMETYSLAIQRRLKIDRSDKADFQFYGGANWCSITGKFATYVAEHFHKYKKYFRFTQNSDELLWQTIVMDSPFRENLYIAGFENNYDACLRYIDWNRGAPYVFRENDYDELMDSNCLFARKFDDKKDKKIIDRLYESLR